VFLALRWHTNVNLIKAEFSMRSTIHWGGLSLTLCALCSQPLQAQSLGISTQGATGGLVIPYAEVLSSGTLAFTYGNYHEPQLGTHATEQNLSFGVGLIPHVELFGRFANYVNPTASVITANGPRDISANFKVQLPTFWSDGPKLALGMNDVAGGAAYFHSGYVVASDQYGPLGVALGYAQGRAGVAPQPTFDGAFGGVAWRFGSTGLSALAEYDGQQKHAGLRWHSEPIPALGNAQVVASLQHSFGALTPAGVYTNTSNFALTLLVPLGDKDTRAADFKPNTSQALPAIEDEPDSGTMHATPEDRLASLRKALMAVGLERVRVGLREGASGALLVVEYENHRYGQNEADALGLVLGLAAELAPKGTERVLAVTFKEGLRLYETSVGVEVYRSFLRDAAASPVRDSLRWERLPADYSAQTHWIDAEPTPASRVRVEIKPDLNYTLGTEVGAFDYALAANLQLIAPLWSGARVYTGYMLPLANSSNMDSGATFDMSRQRRGLKTVALEQSVWLGRQALANVAVGRFNYDTWGVQAEAAVFVPSTDDLLRLRAAGYNQAPGGLAGQDRAFAASYRHLLTPTMWLEAGMQRYSDGTNGPSLEWNRWFGDVSAQIFYRKGGDGQFAGLQLSFPLTPRQGMAPGPVIFTGASQYAQSFRTRLTDSHQSVNLVQPSAALDLRLETSLDVDRLNAGRMSQGYLMEQVYRMREAFFIYAKDKL